MRQLDILPPDKIVGVTVIGTGGVGSAICIFLAKMGVRRFVLYDGDVVQQHNISNQMFPRSSINKPKASVIADEIGRFSPYPSCDIEANTRRFEDDSTLETNVVISALDDMDSRRVVWGCVKNDFTVDLYVDARMGGEVAKVYTVHPQNPDDVSLYEKSLVQGNYMVPCTAQAISYNVAMIASMVCSNIRKFLTDIKTPRLLIGDSFNLDIRRIGGES